MSTLTLVVAGLAVATPAQEKGDTKSERPVIVRYYWTPDPFWRSHWYDSFYDDRYYAYDPYLQYRRELFSKQQKVSEEAEELQKERKEARRDGIITADERKEINEERAEYMKALEELEKFYDKHRYIDIN